MRPDSLFQISRFPGSLRSFASLLVAGSLAGSLAAAQTVPQSSSSSRRSPVAVSSAAATAGKTTPSTRFVRRNGQSDARRKLALQLTEIPGVAHVASSQTRALRSPIAAASIIKPEAVAGPTISSVSPASKSFGSVAVTAAATQTFTFTFSAGGRIAAPAVLTQGAANQDYTDAGTGTCTTNGAAHVYATNDTCTVVVKFLPKKAGTRLGAVELLNSGGTAVVGSAFLTGIGTGPVLTFAPATIPVAPVVTSTSTPYALATDAAGDVFYTLNNGTVQEIVAINGVVSATSTVKQVGSGLGVPAGIAIDGFGNVFVYDATTANVYELLAVGGTVPATPTTVTFPTTFDTGYTCFMAFDPNGNLYLNEVYEDDLGFGLLAEFPATNGAVAAGTGIDELIGFDAPTGLGFDTAGNAYVSDLADGVVYQILVDGGSVDENSAQGAVGPSFNENYGVAVEASGSLLVVDIGTNALYEVPFTGGAYASTAQTLATGLTTARDVAVDLSGNIVVANTGAKAIDLLTLTNPPNLTFANTAVGSTSGSQTVTLENVGNANLKIPIPTSGQNPSLSNYFTLSNSSTCPLSSGSSSSPGFLISGANCTEILSYTPTISGSVTGNLIFTDNNLNGLQVTQTIVMTGATALALTVDVAPASAAKGSTAVPLTFIVGYGGNAAPTATPTVTVNGSSTGVGAIACTVKLGHKNCSLNYNASSLNSGSYSIVATQPADSAYTATSGTGTLTITGTQSFVHAPVKVPVLSGKASAKTL